MALVTLPRITEPSGSNISRALDIVATALNGVLNTFLSKSPSRIFDVVVTTSDTKVEHKLGATPTGYVILRKNADENVWDTDSNANEIILQASGTVTVRILIVP
jgi:hypothetical protein